MDASVRFLLLSGPEQWVKRHKLEQLRAALEKEHGELQVMHHEGRTASLADILDDLRTFSMMQQYKLVIVDEADQFVSEQTRPALERYAKAPVDHATLVLRCTKWNAGRLDKLVTKIKCEPLSGRDLKNWLIDRAATTYDCKLAAPAAMALIDQLGHDMSQMDNELAKLAVLAGPGEAVTAKMISQVVGRASDEQAWAVQEAVLAAVQSGRSGQAIEKIHEVVDLSRQPDVLVVYFVADLVRKLYLATLLKQQGVSDAQIGREMKLWGPRMGMFMNLLRRLDETSAGRLFDRIVNLDARSKSGFGKPMRNLECFCAVLADEIGGKAGN